MSHPIRRDVVDGSSTNAWMRRGTLASILLAILLALTFGRWLVRSSSWPIDFAQYYLGGRMVLLGEPDAIYPIPHPDSTLNAGFIEASDLQPAAAREVQRYGIGGGLRFIQPPPAAVLFVPLAIFPPRAAMCVWLALLCCCQVSVGLIAAKICDRCGGTSRASMLVLIAASLAPGGMQALQIANLSPLMGLLWGLNLLLLLRGREASAGVVFVIGAVIKYWNLALVPIHLARRQFRAAAWALGAGILLLAVSLFLLGVGPYRTYLFEIGPTLGRPIVRTNQSLIAYAMRLNGEQPLNRSMRLVFELVRAAWFVSLAWVTWRGRDRIRSDDGTRCRPGGGLARLAVPLRTDLLGPLRRGPDAGLGMACSSCIPRRMAWLDLRCLHPRDELLHAGLREPHPEAAGPVVHASASGRDCDQRPRHRASVIPPKRAASRNRTGNRRFTKPVLCQLS